MGNARDIVYRRVNNKDNCKQCVASSYSYSRIFMTRNVIKFLIERYLLPSCQYLRLELRPSRQSVCYHIRIDFHLSKLPHSWSPRLLRPTPRTTMQLKVAQRAHRVHLHQWTTDPAETQAEVARKKQKPRKKPNAVKTKVDALAKRETTLTCVGESPMALCVNLAQSTSRS